MSPGKAWLAAALGLCCLCAPALAGDEQACADLPGVGCYYAASSLSSPQRPDLLVYFRGHLLVSAHPEWKASHPDWVAKWSEVSASRIPDPLLADSARQAFAYYGLKDVADAAGLVVLVTGSSHIPVHAAALEALASEKLKLASRRFGTVHLASHSGGFVGLGASRLLPDAGGRRLAADGVGSVVLLDTFYSPAWLAAVLKGYQSRGAVCGGYYTPHNEAGARAFAGPCGLEAAGSDDAHETQVAPSLGSFLRSYYGSAAAGPGARGARWPGGKEFSSRLIDPDF